MALINLILNTLHVIGVINTGMNIERHDLNFKKCGIFGFYKKCFVAYVKGFTIIPMFLDEKMYRCYEYGK